MRRKVPAASFFLASSLRVFCFAFATGFNLSVIDYLDLDIVFWHFVSLSLRVCCVSIIGDTTDI